MYYTFFSSIFLYLKTLRKVRGVEIRILYPGLFLLYILANSYFENLEQHWKRSLLNTPSLERTSKIWVANYWTGTIIIALIFIEGSILLRMGSKKAKVFPVPVGAVTITFLLYSRQGTTCIWTGVGI